HGGTDHRNLAEAKVTPARATGTRSGEGSWCGNDVRHGCGRGAGS
ncbi:MAG: hypothetical protein QOD04_5392, partial [Pseudonocardiales bacterium]|nr:hypothetical protein [Pseudonocardiales bacterium]